MSKKLSILGSTGSIGTQSLEVADMQGYEVTALSAYSNAKLLEKQIRKYKPEVACLVDDKAAQELKISVKDTKTKILSGIEGVCECASFEKADTVINSVVGMAGLEPTLTAVEAGKTIALANKETLVAGGKLVMENARKRGVSILPVDSEHSAIFQSLQGCPDKKAVKKIILTASGGPFFGKRREELENVTLEQALNHPNWSMGAKITVDSASMMNKGLELIEAVWLFGVSPDDIEIVIHRESVIHSLVEYVDNSVIAQLGVPDMRIPIQYALTYPDRIPSPVRELSLTEFMKLTFYKPDYDTFSCINLCRDAIKKGGLYPAVANAANEEANYLFRHGKIKFLQIGEFVRAALDNISAGSDYSCLDDVLEIDRETKAYIKSLA